MRALAIVWVVPLFAGCGGGSGTPVVGKSEAPLLAFHLVHEGERPDLNSRVFEERRIYLEKSPVISDPDILHVDADLRENGVILDLELRPEAAERLRRLTADNIGRALAIRFDSEIISVPVIQSEIGGRAQMLVPADSDEEARQVLEMVRARWPSDQV
jgi:preprotein translocase subunit SecD